VEKAIIMEQVKKDMANHIQVLCENNIIEVKERLEKCFEILSLVINLKNTELTFEQPKISEKVSIEEEEPEKAFLFERKLRGGYLPKIGVYVPESIVRKVGIEHGDFVKVEEKIVDEEITKHYFQIYKKGNRIKPEDRKEINYGLVERDGNIFVVRKTLLNGGEDVRYNDAPYAFLLRNEDILEFQIKEGDIIDLSFSPKDISYNRVIWKHVVEQEIQASSYHSGAYKTKEKSDIKSIPKTLNDKKILVIGCEPRKTVFKENIESRGGIFSFAEGTEGYARLSSMIKKADLVILMIRFIRHRASIDAVEICKQLRKPFSVVENLGVHSVIKEAEQIGDVSA
jgi:DNA-directed RNA polymerase subunit H (RpoH/RPB5)